MTKDRVLGISAIFLSLLVIGQSMAIIETVNHPKQPKQADIFVGEIETDSQPEMTASLWLESKETKDSTYELTLWLENKLPSKAVLAKIRYNPTDIDILDKNATVSGTQIITNSAWDFIIDNIATDSGSIELLAKNEIMSGKYIVATISAIKKTPNLTDISFDYVTNTREGSYVSFDDQGQNILQIPGILSF